MKSLSLFFVIVTFFYFGNDQMYGQDTPWTKKNSTIIKVQPPKEKRVVPVVKRDKYTKAEHEAKILEARIMAEESRIEQNSNKELLGEPMNNEEKAIAIKNLQVAKQKLSQLRAKAGISNY